MSLWAINVLLRAQEPMDDSVLDRFEGFRPEEEDEQCIWVDSEDKTLLNVTSALPANDSHAALKAGREMAEEAIALLDSAARVVDVTVVDDDDEMDTEFVWRPTADDK